MPTIVPMHSIERLRTARGWTQNELARRTGVSVNTVRAWEKGVIPSPVNLRKLSFLFDVDLIALVNSIIQWPDPEQRRERERPTAH